MDTMTRATGRLRAPLGAFVVVLLACAPAAISQALPGFDFTKPGEVALWRATHDVAGLTATADGMLIAISGADPYIQGPARDYPADIPLWLSVRLKSDQAGTGQIFFFTAAVGAHEPDSVRFSVPKAGEWVVARAPMPALGPGTLLRLDPPGVKGSCVVASISFGSRVLPKEPPWPKPTPPDLDGALAVSSGDLTLRQATGQLGGFTVEVSGWQVAIGNNRPLIGYTTKDQLRWLNVADIAKVTASGGGDAVRVRATFDDPDGGAWTIEQDFTKGAAEDAIDVSTRVTVSQARDIIYLPMLMAHPGVGTFGANQDHALLAGLEYMDAQDQSSSEADIVGPGSKRQVPDTEKVTFPLMAIEAEGRYVGLIWEMRPEFSPVFDAPDRLLGSGGHAMGVIFPGSDGVNRVEGSLLPYAGEAVAADKPITLAATIIGGSGTSVVPAIRQYVALRGLPPVPNPGMDKEGYASYAAGGWLDSRIGENGRYRHAYWPGATSFGPGPAADAALWMEWLARTTPDAALTGRLEAAAKAALAQVDPASYNTAGVSHVRYPLGSLVFGSVAENTDRALEAAKNALAGFETDGSIRYRQAPGAPDFGKTHFAPDANGLTAARVSSLLENATVCGDPAMLREGLRVLRALDKFDDSAPRGAQTWEVPLHTPDILASAYLVRAYTMGYELTGEKALLDRAVDWAWTGVPFTYLVEPTPEPVGLYATIPVLGATHWTGSWFGLPVQWCGLVYSDALYRLIRHDPANAATWKRLADGIAASGIQQSFPTAETDLQGLLPDSFNIRPQTRNGVAINPGTVQANAVRLFGGPEVYDFRAFRETGWLVHAPGAIEDARESADGVAFTVRGWTGVPYYVLVVGCKAAPKVRINGEAVALQAPHEYVADKGRLILRVQGTARIELAR
jgi:hypothetical protein